MLSPIDVVDCLIADQVSFFTGVPDSLLKSLCACISDSIDSKRHVIACNEGASVALAIGHHIATGTTPVVYMQNSGLGNAINPLLSLASPEVYSVPMLLIIGWRGEQGVKDEPQHVHQGRVTPDLLSAMDIPYIVISASQDQADAQILDALKLCRSENKPVAILIKKGTFGEYHSKNAKAMSDYPAREEAIGTAASLLDDQDIVVSTTGMISRELFEYRSNNSMGHHRDFLTVGGMGHCSQIAMGIANSIDSPSSVVCFDGDGASLMHMGSMATIGSILKGDFIHIVFNNGVHDSVGGQPSVGFDISLVDVAKATGYSHVYFAENLMALSDAIHKAKEVGGVSFIEARVRPGNRSDLGRPTSSPESNKVALMENIKNLASGGDGSD